MHLLENMSWNEIEEYIKEKPIIVIPTGVYEEHGYHLPVSTDNVIGLEIAKKVGERLQIIVAPLIPFGVSRKTREFPGSIMLQFETHKRLIEDVLSEFVENGFRKLILFSFHGSDNQLMALKEAAYTIKKRFAAIPELKLFIISSLDITDARILKQIKTVPIHACELETSLMLYLAEDLVKMEKAVEEYPKFPEYELILTGKPWMKSGVMGDPRKATKEKGEAVFNLYVENSAHKISAQIK